MRRFCLCFAALREFSTVEKRFVEVWKSHIWSPGVGENALVQGTENLTLNKPSENEIKHTYIQKYELDMNKHSEESLFN